MLAGALNNHRLYAVFLYTYYTYTLNWTESLSQSKAFAAHYLALAESLPCDFWTADKRLVRSARQAGAGWVHWIGELPQSEE